ncbi:MAG TPA: virulence factor [Methylovirgula sp.]|nr:virulence factor [Methylovirgula sp.]
MEIKALGSSAMQLGHNSRRGGRMYAITFDLDTQTLEQAYGGTSWRNACSDIRNALRPFGFNWQQGSVYFGDDGVNAVTCVLAVQDLTGKFPWFRSSVRDIRMLRIEENNDLAPAIEIAATTRS